MCGSAVAGAVALGHSKAGGLPHAPEGFSWPFLKDWPLEFVAQLNPDGMAVAFGVPTSAQGVYR